MAVAGGEVLDLAGWLPPARIGPSSLLGVIGVDELAAPGRDCSSSRDQPSSCSQAGFRSVKQPSSEIVASRSLVISKSLRTPASAPGRSPGRLPGRWLPELHR